MILTPDVMEDGLVHMVYADEVSGNVLILIVVDNGLVQHLRPTYGSKKQS